MTADEWNAKHPIGTPVRFWPVIHPKEGTPVDTVTRSEAWTLGHGAAVVKIAGKAGGVLLEALDVLDAATPPQQEFTAAERADGVTLPGAWGTVEYGIRCLPSCTGPCRCGAMRAMRTLRDLHAVFGGEPGPIDIIFTGPPGPDSGRFIEVENAAGQSIRIGQWIDRGDGTWALRLATPCG